MLSFASIRDFCSGIGGLGIAWEVGFFAYVVGFYLNVLNQSEVRVER